MTTTDVLTEVTRASRRIDAAAEAASEAIRQRDEWVRSARRLGVSTRRIAAAAGITHTQVRRICA